MKLLGFGALLLALAGLTACRTVLPGPRLVTVEVVAPTAGFALSVVEVRRVEDVLHVLAQTRPPAGMAAQVLTPLRQEIAVDQGKKPVREAVIYVLGPPSLQVPVYGGGRTIAIADRSAYDRQVDGAPTVAYTMAD